MNKKITIFAVIILILCLFWGIEVLAQSPTLAVSADSAQYFKVTAINDNEINCKFIYDYESDQNELYLMHFNENCYLTIQNDTIFIDGESKSIVKSIDALNNIEDDMLIVAFLMEDVYDVEKNGIHGDVSIIVYNINDNLIIDHSTPRYYQLQNEFSFYNNLDKSRLLVDEKKVYDENNNQYDVNSILLWQDINVETNEEINMGEEAYNIYTDYNFVEIYWLDNDEQIEKAFLIELKDDERHNIDKITKFEYYFGSNKYANEFFGIRTDELINVNLKEYNDAEVNDKIYTITFEEFRNLLNSTSLVNCEKQTYDYQCGESEGCSYSHFYVYYEDSLDEKNCYQINENVSNFFENIDKKNQGEEMKNNVIKILFGILLSLGGLVLIVLLFKLGYKYLIQEKKTRLR